MKSQFTRPGAPIALADGFLHDTVVGHHQLRYNILDSVFLKNREEKDAYRAASDLLCIGQKSKARKYKAVGR